jgi:hypothetical protein
MHLLYTIAAGAIVVMILVVILAIIETPPQNGKEK